MRTFLIVIGILLGVFVLFGIVNSIVGEEDTKNETYALIYAEKAIKSKLKSPSTSEFPGVRGTSIKKDVDTFYVRSYVDSQNGFGAMMRTNFEVKVMFVGDKVKTSILKLQ
ncbi:hypothetical protein [Autumnicola psychrophila]|uniref:DUF1310 family protein n=1 Tax=Autumnicola psychrophila TaxID=3075592 RepID=A0ABU3DVS5_9FLAO|nr:hypothetical protein [Zunongwangia sp. F225]MDT0687827.1 hypothetical protein [Zunongwangia sp. F225]